MHNATRCIIHWTLGVPGTSLLALYPRPKALPHQGSTTSARLAREVIPLPQVFFFPAKQSNIQRFFVHKYAHAERFLVMTIVPTEILGKHYFLLLMSLLLLLLLLLLLSSSVLFFVVLILIGIGYYPYYYCCYS